MRHTRSDEPLGWLLLAKQLARQAGDLVVSLRHKPPSRPSTTSSANLAIESKSGSSDLVTSADLASQNLIFQGIASAYPKHRLIGEEDSEDYGELDDGPTWIVDAIDGTTNFVHGLSDWAISIAFAKEKVVEVGVVYCPRSGEMFSGVRGHGAFMNDRPIETSKVETLTEAVIISEWGYERGQEGVGKMLAVNERLMVGKTRGVRQLGSGALDICYVGMGRADGVYCGVCGSDAWKIWDYAAACVIAEEAGAVFSTVDGGRFDITSGSMVCAAPGVHKELQAVIKGE